MMQAATILSRELVAAKGNPPILGGVVLQRIIGTGGMGIVYQGTHLRLRIPVAVKLLFDQPDNKENIARFVDEAALSARLNSPCVVRVYDVNKDGAFQYIVQEYVEGVTADQRLRDSVVEAKPLSEGIVLNIAADVARGLAAIHATQHLHLDIKPANLMISRADSSTKILDFGLAKAYDPRDRPGTIPEKGKVPVDGGTPGYSSPEQLQFLSVGPSSDIYSLGVSLFELFSGRRAFNTPTWEEASAVQLENELPDLRSVRPDISGATAELITKCVRIDPGQRYQSALDLLSDVSAAHSLVTKRFQSTVRPADVALPGEAASFPRQIAAGKASQSPLVFCVDDDFRLLDMMTDILSDSDSRIETFTDGRRALQRMRTQVPDVLIVDLEMPMMNGLELCTAMRAAATLKHVPVIFLTSSNSIQSLQNALRHGATDYLLKPVQAGELLARVNCLTRMQRAQQELLNLEAEFNNFQERLSTLTGRKLHV